jgi:membrane protease YdiL (CAAX protease family)
LTPPGLPDAAAPADGVRHDASAAEDGATAEALVVTAEGAAVEAAPDAEGASAAADAPSSPVAPPATAPDPGAPEIDVDGQPRLTLFGLSGRVVPAVYLVAWIASILGAGTITVSILGSRNPFARWLFVAGLVFLAVGLLAAAGSQAIERGRRPSLPFRGPSPVLAFAVVILVTLLASLVVLVPLSATGLDPGGPLGTVVSLAVTTVVFLGTVRVLVVGTGALTWAEIGFSRPIGGAAADLATGALLAIPVVVVEALLLVLLVRLVGTPSSPLPPASTASALILNLLSAAVLAPLGEEVFFRGYTTTAWARVYGQRSAIVRGALFFSFAHIVTLFSTSFQAGLAAAAAQYIALLPAGLALGWVFLQRRSIWASLGLHGAYNALIVLLAFYGTVARG